MGRQKRPQLRLILTGGTCLMEQDAEGHLVLPEEGDARVRELLPHFRSWAQIEVEVFSNVPGEWLTPTIWANLQSHILKALSEVDGVVVVTGTDGLEEISYFLHLTVPSDKPLVLTASLRGLHELGSDAPLNLVDAVRVAAEPEAKGKGVLVVMNRKIYSAREMRKTDTQAVAGFAGEMGPLGLVDREGVFFYRIPVRRHTFTSEFATHKLPTLPRVDILCTYAGADGVLVRALLTTGTRGLVVAGLGSGNVSRELGETLARLASSGFPVVIKYTVLERKGEPHLWVSRGWGGSCRSGLCACGQSFPA